MTDLPYIDEHSRQISASRDAIWAALTKVLRTTMGGSTAFARVLGCDPVRGTPGFSGEPDEAVPGFRVAAGTERGRRLELRGQHRFSRYALTFVLDGDNLRAETHAEFPGVLGRLYRLAVISTGFHRLATRRILRQVARSSK